MLSLPLSDFFFLYEAEYAFRNFLRVVEKAASPATLTQLVVPNVAAADGKATFHFTAWERPVDDELNIIPAYDLMDLAEASVVGRVGAFYSLKDKGSRFATILLNRGCRFQCTFCSVRHFNGVGVRNRSVASVIEELKILKSYGISHVTWLDDDFFYNPARALELFNEMIRADLGMTWDCSNGVVAASCSEELLSAAAASGCIGIYLGVESGNPDILRYVRKPGTVDKFLKAAALLRQQERIHGRAFLIIGFPGETYRMMLDTYKLCLEMDIDWCHINIFQALPNTPLFEVVVERAAAGNKEEFDNLTNIRFNSGAYGKRSQDKQSSVFAMDFEQAFASAADLDSVPNRAELERVWAYMNFHINFDRLFRENRPVKLAQQHRYIRNIIDVVDPDNMFAWWFTGYLSYRLNGTIEPGIISHIEKGLEADPLWRDRFGLFGLSVDELRSGDFSALESQAKAKAPR